MTVRELIQELQSVDEDILDYEVYFTGRVELTKSVRLAFRIPINQVNENVDVDGRKLYLRGVLD